MADDIVSCSSGPLDDYSTIVVVLWMTIVVVLWMTI